MQSVWSNKNLISIYAHFLQSYIYISVHTKSNSFSRDIHIYLRRRKPLTPIHVVTKLHIFNVNVNNERSFTRTGGSSTASYPWNHRFASNNNIYHAIESTNDWTLRVNAYSFIIKLTCFCYYSSCQYRTAEVFENWQRADIFVANDVTVFPSRTE